MISYIALFHVRVSQRLLCSTASCKSLRERERRREGESEGESESDKVCVCVRERQSTIQTLFHVWVSKRLFRSTAGGLWVKTIMISIHLFNQGWRRPKDAKKSAFDRISPHPVWYIWSVAIVVVKIFCVNVKMFCVVVRKCVRIRRCKEFCAHICIYTCRQQLTNTRREATVNCVYVYICTYIYIYIYI